MHNLCSPENVFQLMKEVQNKNAEELWVLSINSHGILIAKEMIFRGTVDMCPAHPRDIFRFILQNNSSTFIIVHNHPSGDPTPSEQDLAFTNRILRISKVCQVPILDHIILGDNKYISLKQIGFFNSARIKRATFFE